MTKEENIKAILNAHFVGFKDEIIDSATNTICELKQEPFMNKPCVSAGVCEHDKMQMLEKLRVELNFLHNGCGLFNDGVDASLKIIDKYRTESKND